jgi:hypothetical protein
MPFKTSQITNTFQQLIYCYSNPIYKKVTGFVTLLILSIGYKLRILAFAAEVAQSVEQLIRNQ